jgi:arginase family enzyme
MFAKCARSGQHGNGYQFRSNAVILFLMKIRILGIPLDLGQARRGVDMGPSAVRAKEFH